MHATESSTSTSFLKRKREQALDRRPYADQWNNRYFSATAYSLWKAAHPLMAAFCRGRVLDAGSGRGGWSRVILSTADLRESIDIAPRGDDHPTWCGDLCSMPEVPTGRYDTVVCHQVLEHVRRPTDAVAEIHRVLAPGGHFLMSVPHLSRRHELPHDYHRFTQEGVTALLNDQGFEVVAIQPYGGIVSFLHHQASSLVLIPVSGIPFVSDALTAINLPLSVAAVALDRATDSNSIAPTGVVAAARKV